MEDFLGDTGAGTVPQKHRVKSYPFKKYVIKVILGEKDEFLGIEEVQVNKDFMSYQQRINASGHHDVDEFYGED